MVEFDVVIEIPKGRRNKYEVDHETGRIGREILIALEAMRPLLDHVPPHARRPLDLTGLGDAFGATDPTAGRSG
jgi:hypothetical protein